MFWNDIYSSKDVMQYSHAYRSFLDHSDDLYDDNVYLTRSETILCTFIGLSGKFISTNLYNLINVY